MGYVVRLSDNAPLCPSGRTEDAAHRYLDIVCQQCKCNGHPPAGAELFDDTDYPKTTSYQGAYYASWPDGTASHAASQEAWYRLGLGACHARGPG
ncbi:hypothetical protein [Glaciibacter sp. 2TAF33]|uniref:hypothetical protein n=1 Tax=Glaciibacter sp. 2TAF33 TaxID=3233015 RepID=UPI003F92F5DE